MTRSELIQELHSVVYNERRNYRKFGDNTRKNITLDTYLSERIADFILSRQKLLLEKIGKVLKEVSNVLDNELGDTDPNFPEDFTDEEIAEEDPVFYACMRVNEALAIIEKEKVGNEKEICL
jgi:hypothetical protein